MFKGTAIMKSFASKSMLVALLTGLFLTTASIAGTDSPREAIATGVSKVYTSANSSYYGSVNYHILLGEDCSGCSSPIANFAYDDKTMTISGKDVEAVEKKLLDKQLYYTFKVYPITNHKGGKHHFVHHALTRFDETEYHSFLHYPDQISYAEVRYDWATSKLHKYRGADIELPLKDWGVENVYSASMFDGGVDHADVFFDSSASEVANPVYKFRSLGKFTLEGTPNENGQFKFDISDILHETWFQDLVTGPQLKYDKYASDLTSTPSSVMVILDDAGCLGVSYFNRRAYSEDKSYAGKRAQHYAGTHFSMSLPQAVAVARQNQDYSSRDHLFHKILKSNESYHFDYDILTKNDVVNVSLEKSSTANPDKWVIADEEVTLNEKESPKNNNRWHIGELALGRELFSDGKTIYRVKLKTKNEYKTEFTYYYKLAEFTKRIQLSATSSTTYGNVYWQWSDFISNTEEFEVNAGETVTLTANSITAGKEFKNWTDSKGEIVSNEASITAGADWFEEKGMLTANFIDATPTGSVLTVSVNGSTSSTQIYDYHKGKENITLKVEAESSREIQQRAYYQIKNSDGTWGEHNFSIILSSDNNYKDASSIDITSKYLNSAESPEVVIRFVLRAPSNSTIPTTYSNELTFRILNKVTLECYRGNDPTHGCHDLMAGFTDPAGDFITAEFIEGTFTKYCWVPYGSTVYMKADPANFYSFDHWEFCSEREHSCGVRNFISLTGDNANLPDFNAGAHQEYAWASPVTNNLYFKAYFDDRTLNTTIQSSTHLQAGSAILLDAYGDQSLKDYTLAKATKFDVLGQPEYTDVDEDLNFNLAPGQYRLTVNLGFRNEDDKLVAQRCNMPIGCDGTEQVNFYAYNGSEWTTTKLVRNYDKPYKGGDTISYYHFFTIEGYTISFLDGDKPLGEHYVPENGKLNEREFIAAKDGYTLVGWFTDTDCKKEWDYDTEISKDINLYAKWEKNTTESSSDSKAEDNSSSSGKSDAIVSATAKPMYLTMHVSGHLVQIAGAQIGSRYAVFDMQGRVMANGFAKSANLSVTLPNSGNYMVRIGNQTVHITIK